MVCNEFEYQYRPDVLSYDYRLEKPHRNVMVSMLPSSVIDRGFGPRRSKIKDYKIGICCFSSKHVALKITSKSNDLLA